MSGKKVAASERSAEVQAEDARLRVSVAALLNRAREEAGMSNRDLAQKIGIADSNVSRTLSGDQNVCLETLARWSVALGIRVSVEVVGEIEGPPS